MLRKSLSSSLSLLHSQPPQPESPLQSPRIAWTTVGRHSLGVMSTRGGRVGVLRHWWGLVVTLVLLMQCCWRDARGEENVGWLGSEECAARRLGSQPDTNYCGQGMLRPPCQRHQGSVGAGGSGGGEGTGKVRSTDRLERSTRSLRVHPPFRPKLSGRNCGCHHGNSSS